MKEAKHRLKTAVAMTVAACILAMPLTANAQDHGNSGHHNNGRRGNDHQNNGRRGNDHQNNGRRGNSDHQNNGRREFEQRQQARRDFAHRQLVQREIEHRQYLQREAEHRRYLQLQFEHRQRTKNNWRNLTYVSGAVALIGLLGHDTFLAFAGAAGALYSYQRYDHDRRSQNRMERERASYFERGSYRRGGHVYYRRVVVLHGRKYMQFVRKH